MTASATARVGNRSSGKGLEWRAPSFSSDGARLVFVRRQTFDDVIQGTLFEQQLDVAPMPAPTPLDLATPTGTSLPGIDDHEHRFGATAAIFFTVNPASAQSDVLCTKEGSSEVFNLTSTIARRAKQPVSLPDGQTIAFASDHDDEGFRIFGAAPTSSLIEHLSPESLWAHQRYLAGPTRLLVAGADAGATALPTYHRIYAFDMGGSTVEALTPEGFQASHPTVAYDLVPGARALVPRRHFGSTLATCASWTCCGA